MKLLVLLFLLSSNAIALPDDEAKCLDNCKESPRFEGYVFTGRECAFSSRIDLLEKFITENTDQDGTKVGFRKEDE